MRFTIFIRMKRISSETQLYVELAHRGDPSAFYALFGGQIRDLYLHLRMQGRDHGAACDEAARLIAGAYRRFLRSRPFRPERWFAARCGLKRFDASAAGAAASKTEIAAYERLAVKAVNSAYSDLLGSSGDEGEDVVGKRPLVSYLVGGAAALVVVVFLFISQAVLSVSFGRFGAEYKLSFPKIADGLWDVSGLVRTEDDAWSRGGAPPAPAPEATAPAQGAEAAKRP